MNRTEVDFKDMAVSSATPLPAVTVRRVSRAHLLSLEESWDNLSENAAVENPYYARPYARALLRHLEPARDVEALCAFMGGHLVGLLPFETSRRRWVGLGKVNLAWTTPYTMSTVPLIHRSHQEAVIPALAEAMRTLVPESPFWLFSDLPTEPNPVADLLSSIEGRGGRLENLASYERPALSKGQDFETHMRTHVSKNRRKGLNRNRRRLEELGSVRFTNSNSGLELAHAVEAFLEIEASGWKGRAGTALDCAPETRAFGLSAFGPRAGRSICRADCLWLDGTVIAVSLSLQSGRTAHTLKAAYDESYRAYAPGLLLEQEIMRDFLDGNWADHLDSATGPGHPLEGLWGDRMKVSDVLLCAAPISAARFARWRQIERTKREARNVLKQAYHRLRGLSGI